MLRHVRCGGHWTHSPSKTQAGSGYFNSNRRANLVVRALPGTQPPHPGQSSKGSIDQVQVCRRENSDEKWVGLSASPHQIDGGRSREGLVTLGADRAVGANATLAMRHDLREPAGTFQEVLACGTANVVEQASGRPPRPPHRWASRVRRPLDLEWVTMSANEEVHAPAPGLVVVAQSPSQRAHHVQHLCRWGIGRDLEQ